jgi:hypothetical protein
MAYFLYILTKKYIASNFIEKIEHNNIKLKICILNRQLFDGQIKKTI